MSRISSSQAVMPATTWKAAFADAVVRLLPDLNPDAADEASDTAYRRAGTLAPEAAALGWVTSKSGNASAV